MRAKTKVLFAGAALIVGLALPSVASADVRSFATTFNPNDGRPTFNPEPAYPVIPYSVSYDSGSGVLTISEGGGSSMYSRGWEPTHFTVTGPGTEQAVADWDPGANAPGALSVSGVDGALQPTVTKTGDTLSAVYSSALLAGHDYDHVRIRAEYPQGGGCDASPCDPNISSYFPGACPTISVPSPGPLATIVGSNVFDQPVGEPSIVGVAWDDLSAPPDVVETVSGLPPGLSYSDGAITGTPSTGGVYTVTLAASAWINDGTQTVTSSVTFPWTIVAPPPGPYVAPPTPRIPTYLGSPFRGDLQVKPTRITYTGDGTGFLAGYGRPSHRPNIGHLQWAQWTATQALASGADWDDNCTPDCAGGLRSAYRVRIRLSQPAHIGGYYVFSRLTATFTGRLPSYQHRRSYTWRLHYEGNSGGFSWSI